MTSTSFRESMGENDNQWDRTPNLYCLTQTQNLRPSTSESVQNQRLSMPVKTQGFTLSSQKDQTNRMSYSQIQNVGDKENSRNTANINAVEFNDKKQSETQSHVNKARYTDSILYVKSAENKRISTNPTLIENSTPTGMELRGSLQNRRISSSENQVLEPTHTSVSERKSYVRPQSDVISSSAPENNADLDQFKSVPRSGSKNLLTSRRETEIIKESEEEHTQNESTERLSLRKEQSFDPRKSSVSLLKAQKQQKEGSGTFWTLAILVLLFASLFSFTHFFNNDVSNLSANDVQSTVVPTTQTTYSNDYQRQTTGTQGQLTTPLDDQQKTTETNTKVDSSQVYQSELSNNNQAISELNSMHYQKVSESIVKQLDSQITKNQQIRVRDFQEEFQASFSQNFRNYLQPYLEREIQRQNIIIVTQETNDELYFTKNQ